MLFGDYESFVMLSWMLLAPTLAAVAVLSIVVERLSDRNPNLSGFNRIVQIAVLIVAGFSLIEWAIGVYRTYEVSKGNTIVFPDDGDVFGWMVFAAIYGLPVVFALFAVRMYRHSYIET